MKLHYYPETDSLYIELKAEPGDGNIECEGTDCSIDTSAGFDMLTVGLVGGIGAVVAGGALVLKKRKM